MKRSRSLAFGRDLDILYRAGTVGGSTDRELLAHFQGADRATAQRAFETLVGRYGPMVLGVCRRVLGDRNGAEDAFQATFLVLGVRPGAIRKPDSLGPWLHGVAARIARRARTMADRRREQPLAPEGTALLVSVSAYDDAAELRSVLDEEVGRLPARLRSPVVLCLLEGKTQEEAARSLGWTRRTVAGRLARAKDLLRSRLTRRGFAPSAALIAAIFAEESASAAVPVVLSDNAVRTAIGVVLGRGEMIAAPSPVSALARGALRAMVLGRVKTLVAAALVLATFAAAVAQISAGPEPAAQALLLGDTPPRQPQPVASGKDSRRPEPQLPAHARTRLGTTRLRHQWEVWNVAFTPNGRTLASTGPDARIRFWDLATGEPASNLPTITEPGPWRGSIAESLAYSPDGTLLAIGRYGGLVQLWDLVAGRERFRSEAHKGRLHAIAFAPDGRTFVTASDEKLLIRIWDVATGRLQRMLPFSEEENYGASLAFSPDGKRLALGTTLQRPGEAVICAWNLDDSAAPIVIRKPHEFAADCNSEAILAAALGNDGTLISAAEVTAEANQPTLLKRYLPWKKNRRSSKLQIRFWDTRTGERKNEMNTELANSASWMTVSRDRKTLVTSLPDRLLVWDLATQKTVQTIPTNGGWCAAISPDGKTLAGARGNAVRLWDVATATPLLGSDNSQESAVAAAICPDATLAATADQYGNLRVWDPTRVEAVRALAMFQRTQTVVLRGPTPTVRFSPDGRQLAASGQYDDAAIDHRIGVFRLWDVHSFHPVLDEQRIDRAASVLEFSFDGSQVAAVFSKLPFAAYLNGRPLKPADDDVIELFSARTGKKTGQLRGHGRAVKAITFTRDGRGLVSAGEDKTFRFWDLATGQASRVIPIEGHHTSALMDQPGVPAELTATAFSADCATAVTSARFDNQLFVWDLQSGRIRRTFTVEAYFDGALAISPDGRLLAAAMSPIRGTQISIKDPETLMELPDTPIMIWDIATKRERLRLLPNVRTVSSLAFAANGKTLISGLSDTTALVWDVSAAYTPLERR
jgi:RNA polymerase sigma factor (sigma-70 family)